MNDYEHDALLRIKSQLDFGYLDIDKDYDEVEFDVISEAIKEYESNHKWIDTLPYSELITGKIGEI